MFNNVKEYYSQRFIDLINDLIGVKTFSVDYYNLQLNRQEIDDEVSYEIILSKKEESTKEVIIFSPRQVMGFPDDIDTTNPQKVYKQIEQIYSEYRALQELIEKEIIKIKSEVQGTTSQPEDYQPRGVYRREDLDKIENIQTEYAYKKEEASYEFTFIHRIFKEAGVTVEREKELIYQDGKVFYKTVF